MSKSRKDLKIKFDAAWEALPERDRRFMAALSALLDIFGDGAFRFRELPERIVRLLHEADRDTRFNVIVECLGLLLDAPILERIKRGRCARGREASPKSRFTGRPETSSSQGTIEMNAECTENAGLATAVDRCTTHGDPAGGDNASDSAGNVLPTISAGEARPTKGAHCSRVAAHAAEHVGRSLAADCDSTHDNPAGNVHTTNSAGIARPTEPLCFSLSALMDDLKPHEELDLRTLAYHLQQSDATAADGYLHAAINEARSALEALIISIVQIVVKTAGNENTPLLERAQNGTAFRTYRRCLLDTGFIDADENEMLQFVYSIASARGSHQGVTDEVWTRLARRIVFAAMQYFTQRYGAWKQSEHAFKPSPSKKSPSNPPPSKESLSDPPQAVRSETTNDKAVRRTWRSRLAAAVARFGIRVRAQSAEGRTATPPGTGDTEPGSPPPPGRTPP